MRTMTSHIKDIHWAYNVYENITDNEVSSFKSLAR